MYSVAQAHRSLSLTLIAWGVAEISHIFKTVYVSKLS